jgi:hypothetical protein
MGLRAWNLALVWRRGNTKWCFGVFWDLLRLSSIDKQGGDLGCISSGSGVEEIGTVRRNIEVHVTES